MSYINQVVESMRLTNAPVPPTLLAEVCGRDCDVSEMTDDEVVRVALVEAHAALENQHQYIRELENRLVMARVKRPKRG